MFKSFELPEYEMALARSKPSILLLALALELHISDIQGNPSVKQSTLVAGHLENLKELAQCLYKSTQVFQQLREGTVINVFCA